MKLPDENGAHHATPGTDPVSGVRYIIDLPPSYRRVYLAGPCRICGVETLSSEPFPRSCGACLPGRVARNDDEAA